MSGIFQTILYQPLFNILVGLYQIIPGHDLGLAIIAITVLMRLALYPVSKKAIIAQKQLQALQPKIEEVKLQYKDDKQGQATALMALYKEHNMNPAGSCVPLLLQIPVFIALYWVLGAGLKSEHLDILYSFIPNPGTLNTIAFGFLNLNEPNIYLAVAAGLAQFWQGSQLSTKQPKPKVDGAQDESVSAMMNTQLKYMLPIVTVFIGAKLASGLTLYWFFSTIIYAAQQYVVMKKHS